MTTTLFVEFDIKPGATDAFKHSLKKLRTGRASLALVDGVNVDYYGSSTPLNQVASLSVPDPTTIAIAPWEPGILGEIEKAILKSNLGLTPNNDGKVVRLRIPALTEERRRDLVKIARDQAGIPPRAEVQLVHGPHVGLLSSLQLGKGFVEGPELPWTDDVRTTMPPPTPVPSVTVMTTPSVFRPAPNRISARPAASPIMYALFKRPPGTGCLR